MHDATQVPIAPWDAAQRIVSAITRHSRRRPQMAPPWLSRANAPYTVLFASRVGSNNGVSALERCRHAYTHALMQVENALHGPALLIVTRGPNHHRSAPHHK